MLKSLTSHHEEMLEPAVRALLAWFESDGRVFPWRQTENAFHILLAEKLLQQTAVGERLLGVYAKVVSTYPTPALLCIADHDELTEMIAPLGLQYRSSELIQMANELVERHSGRVPADRIALISLTGIGEYCSRAVMCFAFLQDIAIVDTNVARFLLRFLGKREALPSNPARSRRLLQMQQELLPQGQSRPFQLGVLDLCSVFCRPKRPLCSPCPVRPWCRFASGSESGEVALKRNAIRS